MRVAAVARAVTECFGYAHSDGNAEHGTGPHANTQRVRHANSLRDHGGVERHHGQAFKHYQDIKERHASKLGHLGQGDAHADRPRLDHNG